MVIGTPGAMFYATQTLVRVDEDFDVKKWDTPRTPIVLWAVTSQNVEALLIAIQLGANPNMGNRRHWTPLHRAASAGNLQMVKILLEAGANVNVEASYPQYALQGSSVKRYWYEEGKTALDVTPFTATEITALLLSRGARPGIGQNAESPAETLVPVSKTVSNTGSIPAKTRIEVVDDPSDLVVVKGHKLKLS